MFCFVTNQTRNNLLKTTIYLCIYKFYSEFSCATEVYKSNRPINPRNYCLLIFINIFKDSIATVCVNLHKHFTSILILKVR